MTTRITVTTGDGGLLERNAQQQAAARQAALVKAQAEQAAATGAEQQRQRRITSGLDPDTGRPLSSAGSTSRLTRIDQEPAAFRADSNYGFVPVHRNQITGVSRYLYSLDGTTRIELASWTKLNAGPLLSPPAPVALDVKFNGGSDVADWPPGYGPGDSIPELIGGAIVRGSSHQNELTAQQHKYVLPVDNGTAVYIDIVTQGQAVVTYSSPYISDVYEGSLEDVVYDAAGSSAFFDASGFYNQTFSGSATYYKITCYLVSGTAVKLVNTPETLESVIKTYFVPEFEYRLETFYVLRGGVGLVYYPYQKYTPVLPGYFNPDLSTSTLGLLKTYGLISSGSTVTTPAFLDTLARPSQVLQEYANPELERETYATVDALLEFSPKRFASVTTSSLPTTQQYFQYNGTTPATVDQEPDPVNNPELFQAKKAAGQYFTPPTAETGLIITELTTPLGQPQFCRQKLVALGFTESDLTP